MRIGAGGRQSRGFVRCVCDVMELDWGWAMAGEVMRERKGGGETHEKKDGSKEKRGDEFQWGMERVVGGRIR